MYLNDVEYLISNPYAVVFKIQWLNNCKMHLNNKDLNSYQVFACLASVKYFILKYTEENI